MKQSRLLARHLPSWIRLGLLAAITAIFLLAACSAPIPSDQESFYSYVAKLEPKIRALNYKMDLAINYYHAEIELALRKQIKKEIDRRAEYEE